MNILHYTIGLPPERRGGSVQYAHDLMAEQVRQGHNVIALVCGDTLFRFGKTSVRKRKVRDGIKVYSLAHPLTPTLIYGVSEPDKQHAQVEFEKDAIKALIEEHAVEVMHIHTLMGLHRDIVAFIKGFGVKIVYTSHDFHGICPHYNLIDWKGELCETATPGRCARCNAREPSEGFLRIANSHLYHWLKNSRVGKALRQSGSKRLTESSTHGRYLAEDCPAPDENRVLQFKNLLAYYRDYFSLIDTFHFNSSQTRVKFEHFLGALKGEVIPVVTAGIQDKRRHLEINDNITLGFVGCLNDYKGFPMLKEVIRDLYADGVRNLRIKAYGGGRDGIDEECPLIEYMPSYRYSELSETLYHLDGTIVPSKWYETFSLVTLESLAHGRPVICSDHVGAKDIIYKYSPDFVFSLKDELKRILRNLSIDKTLLYNYHKALMTGKWQYDITSHTKKIINLYK